MPENLPNISLDDIENEYARSNEGANDKKPSTFSEKNYLNVRLAKGENVKQITIRILPTSETVANPFTHVHFHSVQLKDAEKGETQWKTYVCLNPRNNPDIDHEQFGNKCPFCEENYKAYQESIKEGVSPAQKEILQKYSISNKPKEAVILRCIERGKENEGVKFWKFNIRQDKTDPYNKLINLVRQRNLESIKALGVKKNILDCYSGRDIHLTITADARRFEWKFFVICRFHCKPCDFIVYFQFGFVHVPVHFQNRRSRFPQGIQGNAGIIQYQGGQLGRIPGG